MNSKGPDQPSKSHDLIRAYYLYTNMGALSDKVLSNIRTDSVHSAHAQSINSVVSTWWWWWWWWCVCVWGGGGGVTGVNEVRVFELVFRKPTTFIHVAFEKKRSHSCTRSSEMSTHSYTAL